MINPKTTLSLTVALIASFLICSTSHAALQEKDVRAYMQKLEQLAEQKKAKELLLNYAKNAKLLMKFKAPDGTIQKKKLDKQQLSELVTQNLKLAVKYEIETEIKSIKINAKKNKATVVAYLTETSVMENGTFTTRSRNKYVIYSVKNRLVIGAVASELLEISQQ